MTSPETPASSAGSQPEPPDDFEPTGVPGLKTWRSVYVFVLACFVLSVALLVALTRNYR